MQPRLVLLVMVGSPREKRCTSILKYLQSDRAGVNWLIGGRGADPRKFRI